MDVYYINVYINRYIKSKHHFFPNFPHFINFKYIDIEFLASDQPGCLFFLGRAFVVCWEETFAVSFQA